MKKMILIFAFLHFYLLTYSQSNQTCEFCIKLLEIAREHKSEFSNEEIFLFLKNTKLIESNGSHNNGSGFSFDDLNFNDNSDRQEYNKIQDEQTTVSSYSNTQFLQKVAVSLKGWDAINNCIQKLGQDDVYKNRSYLTYTIISNSIEITLWPIADYGTPKLKLVDWKITGPVKYEDKKNKAYQKLEPKLRLNSNQPVNTTYTINEPCGSINIYYRLSNMEQAVTIPIIYDNFKVIDQPINTILDFNKNIPDISDIHENEWNFTGLIHYYTANDNTELRASVKMIIWNPTNENESIRKYSVNDLVLLPSMNGKKLSMNSRVIKFNNGKPGIGSDTGLKIIPQGSGLKFLYLLNNDNDELNYFGNFNLYVDDHNLNIKYEPTRNLLSYLNLRIGDDCR